MQKVPSRLFHLDGDCDDVRRDVKMTGRRREDEKTTEKQPDFAPFPSDCDRTLPVSDVISPSVLLVLRSSFLLCRPNLYSFKDCLPG